jgi:hypothetical protein
VRLGFIHLPYPQVAGRAPELNEYFSVREESKSEVMLSVSDADCKVPLKQMARFGY